MNRRPLVLQRSASRYSTGLARGDVRAHGYGRRVHSKILGGLSDNINE
ncbi:MAG TPA: hypothetical protein VNO35_28330 [Steroidobacteraceae bacterium]|nr:hypothetical protein [Steroidobacteraceae bacterium]